MRVKEKSKKDDLKLSMKQITIMASDPMSVWQIEGRKVESVTILFSWAPVSLQMVIAAKKLKDSYSSEVKLWQTYCIKKQKHNFASKGLYSQSYGFSITYVWMRKLDYEEGWALKNWCFGIVVLEKTFESPLNSKEIKPVNPIGNQPWIVIGRTDAEAEAPVLWPPDGES